MRHPHTGKLVAICGLLFLISFTVNATHAAAATTQQTPTGIIVPLYSYPGPDWSNLAWAKQANPGVPMIAVINPDSGPGYFRDPNFVSGISSLQSAGVAVVGYVATEYASVSISTVESEIAQYKGWYGLNGVYLDQMSNVQGYQSYYSTLTAYAKSLGMTMVVGNPGTSTPPSFIGTVSFMVIYESPGAPSTSSLSQLASYGKGNFGFVAYGVSSLDTAYVDTAAQYVSYIYLTNGVWPNPYAPDSSYLDNLATVLAAYDSSLSGSPQGSPADTSGTITVTTVNQDGQEIYGMYTALLHNGAVAQSCFSPCTLTVNGGQSYQVEVANYGSYAFTEWGNGLQSRYFPVVEPASATQLSLWAFYST